MCWIWTGSRYGRLLVYLVELVGSLQHHWGVPEPDIRHTGRAHLVALGGGTEVEDNTTVQYPVHPCQ